MAPAMEPKAAPTGSRWTLPVLLLIVFLNQIGFGVVFPLQPFYAKVFGAPAWQITLMFAIFSLGQFLGELGWGRLSDRIGRRAVLLITIFLSALCYVAFAYAPTIWIAIAVRGVSGVFAGNISVTQAYVVDVSPPERIGARIGIMGMAFALGFVMGPSLGGFLTRPELGAAGYRTPLLVAGALTLVAALGVILFVREAKVFDRKDAAGTPSLAAALVGALGDLVLRRLLLSTFICFWAISAVWSTSGLWGEAKFGWGPWEVGIVLAVAGAVGAFAQGVSGAAVRRMGDVRTIVAGLLVSSAFLLALALSPGSLWAGAALCIAGLGHAISQPASTSLVSQAAPSGSQGSMLGANTAAAALGRSAGPLMAGFLYSGIGPLAPVFMASAAMIPGAWLALRAGQELLRRRRL